jgi:hypothetical protein
VVMVIDGSGGGGRNSSKACDGGVNDEGTK